MNVTVSVNGRFHAFDLAQQLQRRGYLQRLITSYPKFKVREWDIDAHRIRTILSHELISRGWRSLAGRLHLRGLDYLFNFRFDRLAARHVPAGTDIAVAWSGSARETLRSARACGAITVLERNSSHIVFQRDILKEEYAEAGNAPSPDPRIVDRELEEYEEARYICVPSTFARESFLRQGVPPGKVFLVPFGVDTAAFPPGQKHDNVFRIIFCGALSIRKGLPYLLQAFHEARLPQAELWLVGPRMAEIDPYLHRFAGPNVILKGTQPQSQLYRLYQQGSVFCLPSIEDGFAMTITQAMACELPVIISTHTTAHDVVRHGVDGFVIPIRSVEDIKLSLSALYSDRERCRQMGISARRRILDGFTWNHFGDGMIAQYERLISGQPPLSSPCLAQETVR